MGILNDEFLQIYPGAGPDDFDESVYDDESLLHYGMPRRSGRYPWGSGEDPYQHSSVRC